MKKNDVLGLLFIILFFGLIMVVGCKTPKLEGNEEVEIEDVEDKTEEEEEEIIDATKLNVYFLFDKTWGIIKDYEKEEDINYYKIEELEDKDIKMVASNNDADTGPTSYTILTDDGKLYNFARECSAVEEDRSKYDCVQLMDKSYLVDDIKYYSGYDYSNSLSYKTMLFYSGDKVYNNFDDLVDLNKYIVYGHNSQGLGGYSDYSLTYNGIPIKDKDSGKEIYYKYIITVNNGNNSYNHNDNVDFYIISKDDKLYKVDEFGEYLTSTAKIKDYKYKDSYVNEIDYEVKCENRVCNMTVILDNGEALNFLG